MKKLQESYKVENSEDFFSAISKNNIGVKIPVELRNDILEMDEDKKSLYEETFEYFNNLFDNNNIKTVYGIQTLLKFVESMEQLVELADNLENNSDNGYDNIYAKECFIYLIKYAKEEWSQKYISKALENVYDFCVYYSDEFIDEVYSHGSLGKGSGNWKDVIMLYPRHVRGGEEKINPFETDGDGWQLFVPTSFDGERAIAWYGTNPKDMKPTEWCTRASIYQYRQYSGHNEDDNFDINLYVIRNLHTGKAWQVSIRRDSFNFLNEKDKSDEYTNGDLSIFPDKMLDLIEDDFIQFFDAPARSLLDYKNYTMSNELKKDNFYSDSSRYIENPYVVSWSKTYKNTVDPILNKVKDFKSLEIYKYQNACLEKDVYNNEKESIHDFFEHDLEYGYRDAADAEDEGYIPQLSMPYGLISKKPIYRVVLKNQPSIYKDLYYDNGIQESNDVIDNDEFNKDFDEYTGKDKHNQRIPTDSEDKNVREIYKQTISSYYAEHAQDFNNHLLAIDNPSQIQIDPTYDVYKVPIFSEIAYILDKGKYRMRIDGVHIKYTNDGVERKAVWKGEYINDVHTTPEISSILNNFRVCLVSDLKRTLIKYILPTNKWYEMLNSIFRKVIRG